MPKPPVNNTTTTTPAPPKRVKDKHVKVYKFDVYTLSNNYSSEYELLVSVVVKFKDTFEFLSGRILNSAKEEAEAYVRNIGAFGLTVEDPKATFNYYPANRIAKIVYSVLRAEESED